MAEETAAQSAAKTVTLSDIKGIDSMSELWTETVDIWQHGFMGIDIGKMMTAIAIFGAFLIIRGLFSKYILSHLHRFTDKTKTHIDNKIADALIPPIRFVPVIIGFFVAMNYSGLDEKIGFVFDNTVRSMITFTIFWGMYRVIVPLSNSMDKLERVLSRALVDWIFKVLRVLVIFMGAAVILELWGIQVAPLLAGLGLFGAAVALGAQDLFKNLIGGITVLAEKRFNPGEWIKVDGVVEGTVERIGFRSTKVIRFDKAPVYVPNAQLSDASVTNFTRMSHRRIFWMVGVEYRTTVEQLQIIRDGIMDYIQNNDDFDKDVTTFVRVDSFGASSIDFIVYCFTKTVDWGEYLKVKEEFAFKVKEVIEKDAGTGFAFPSQSVYIEKMPDDAPEMFVPPSKSDAA